MDWQQIVFIITFLVAIFTAAIQLGMLRNQIMINTGRLARLEEKADETSTQNANTNARWPDLERRITRLESIINHTTITIPKEALKK